MAQFDVHKLASGTLVVDIQTNVLSRLATRVVVPLISRKNLTLFDAADRCTQTAETIAFETAPTQSP